MGQPQLTLGQSEPEAGSAHTRGAKRPGRHQGRNRVALPNASAAVVRVFEHWVDMLDKNPKRCALGPTRRKVIARALELYDEEVVLLAIEGCATDPWHLGDNDHGTEYTDLEMILRDEAHIERFAQRGEDARERADREHAGQEQAARVAAAHAAGGGEAAPTAEQAQAARDRLRDLQRRIASSVGRRG